MKLVEIYILCIHDMLRISGKHFKFSCPGQVVFLTIEGNSSGGVRGSGIIN